MRDGARRRLIRAGALGTFRSGGFLRMAGVTRWAVLLAAAGLCACSRPPNPVVAHDPIPQPPPGYAVRCSSTPFILNGYIAYCIPGLKPVEERVIVRAKG
jgi:hypothetical protein